MICKKCGAEIPKESSSCIFCGAAVKQQEKTGKALKGDSWLRGKKRMRLILTGGFVVIVLAAILVLLLTSGVPDYEEPVANIIKGMQTGNAKSIVKAYPDYVAMEDVPVSLLGSRITDVFRAAYGDDYYISYTVLDKKKLTDKEYREEQTELSLKFGDYEIKEAYELSLEIQVEGSRKTNRKETKVKVYKINSKWCIIGNFNYEVFF